MSIYHRRQLVGPDVLDLMMILDIHDFHQEQAIYSMCTLAEQVPQKERSVIITKSVVGPNIDSYKLSQRAYRLSDTVRAMTPTLSGGTQKLVSVLSLIHI